MSLEIRPIAALYPPPPPSPYKNVLYSPAILSIALDLRSQWSKGLDAHVYARHLRPFLLYQSKKQIWVGI